ncbi:hypothetical protein DL96DRAFT_1624603 [Flagelloscypha sp. PMI_526]|nr:hypothetical protein DL96DRAFT_1624603 [Flagelloscypha sp. PMI_526]
MLYCFVCRYMRAYHRAALFDSVELVDNRSCSPRSPRPSRVLALYRALSASSDLGQLVHTLIIDTYSKKEVVTKTLAKLPPLLPNVIDLRLEGPWRSDRLFRKFIREALICWQKTLQRLSIKDISHWPLGLFFGWEALEHLNIDNADELLFSSQQAEQVMSIPTRPSYFSPKAVVQMTFRRRHPIQDNSLVAQTSDQAEPHFSTVPGLPLKALSLHFQKSLLQSSLSDSITAGSYLIRRYGPTLSELHITGNFTGFTLAPKDLPLLRYLRIDVEPIFVREPGLELISLIWLIQVIRQQSSANERGIQWNLKDVQLNTLWFPKNKTKPAVLLQLQALAQALVEFNETIPKLSIVTRWSRLQKWKELVRDLEEVDACVRGTDCS